MNPDLEATEAVFSSLRPAPSGVDRDRLMYLAGRAATGAGSADVQRPRGRWLWPCSTAASLLVAVTFAGMWLSHGEPEVRIVFRDPPVAVPEPSEQPAEATDVVDASPRESWRTDYLRLRRLVMTEGVEAMPPGAAPAADVETLRWRSGFSRTLEELLEGGMAFRGDVGWASPTTIVSSLDCLFGGQSPPYSVCTSVHKRRKPLVKLAIRYLTLTIALPIVLSTASAGQETYDSLQEEPGKSDPKPPPAEVVQLTVHPAGPARAALEHRLLPSYLEKTYGNAAPLYTKACLLRSSGDKASIDLSELLRKPDEQLSLEQLRETLRHFEGVLRQLELASRRTHCDWGLPIWEADNPYEILLPELQDARDLARLIALKARLQIAEGRFDDAVHSLQIGFALGRNVADQPTLVGGLVGMAIASVMAAQVEALLQLPDAPNLYWSLTALPTPLVDLADALEMESAAMYLVFPLFDQVKTTDYTPAQWEALFDEDEVLAKFASLLSVDQEDLPTKKKELRDRFDEAHPLAKRELAARGYSQGEVDRMPASQAVVLHTLLRYDELRDAMFKWFHVPYWQARASVARAQKEIEEAGKLEAIPLASVLLPAVANCQLAMTRTDRQVAALRTIEAIRLHAASHDGKLPESLDQITEVPVPVNPFTGQPFVYRLDGDTAVLEASGPERSHPREFRLELAD